MIRTAKPKKLDSRELADIIVEAASNKKAEEITVLDIQKISSLADFFIILTSGSSPQTKAIVNSIEEELRKVGIKGIRIEGRESSGWMLMDIGDIIVHIMDADMRQTYKLEELWGKGGITYHT